MSQIAVSKVFYEKHKRTFELQNMKFKWCKKHCQYERNLRDNLKFDTETEFIERLEKQDISDAEHTPYDR